MGQRHQLFVIAKVNGRYRNLAAVHHQWLSGLSALKRCYKLIKIFEEPTNHHLLTHELKEAEKLPDHAWDYEQWTDGPPQFPFIATCLSMGASFDLDEGYHHNILLEPWNMPFDHGDNNDGVTILDVTRPNAVRYCFVNLFGEYDQASEEVENEDERQRTIARTPLQGNEYLIGYYSKNTWQAEHFKGVELLGKHPLIAVDDINEACPRDTWCSRRELGLPDPPASGYGQVFLEPAAALQKPSLTALSFRAVIEQALESDDVDSILQEAGMLPMFRPALRKYLYANPTLVQDKRSGFALLQFVLEDSSELDLSQFNALSVEQVKCLVERARSGRLTFVDLSGNANITAHDVLKIFDQKAVTTLCLWNTPAISYTDTLDLMSSGRIKEALHPSRFKEAFDSTHCPSFTRFWANSGVPEVIPFFKPPVSAIKQMLYVCPPSRDLSSQKTTKDSEVYGVEWREYVKDKTQRTLNINAGVLPLQDLVITPSQLGSALSRVMRYLVSESWGFSGMDSGTIAMAVAKCFSQLHPQTDLAIYPSPPTLHHLGRSTSSSSNRIPWTMAPLAPGEYTILLIQDMPESESGRRYDRSTVRFRYAFLTHDAAGDPQVLDMEAYLRRFSAEAHLASWDEETARTQVEVALCDEKTVGNVLAMFEILATKEKDFGWAFRH